MTKMEARVTLAELGVPLAALNGFQDRVAPDWAGRPSLSLDDAAQFHRERQEATAAHEARWRAHQADNERWLAGRAEAGRRAGLVATVELRRSGLVSSAAHNAYQAAYFVAVLAWQAENPRPEWNGQPTLPDVILVAEADAPLSINENDDRIWQEVPT